MNSLPMPEVHPRRVLLVEDDSIQARGLVRLLEGEGAIVHSVTTVAGALAAVASQETYDVIISDAALPDGAGTDIGRRLRRPMLLSYSGRDGWPRWFDVAVTKPDVGGLLRLLRRPKLTVVITEIGEGEHLGRCHETGLACRGGTPGHALRILGTAIDTGVTGAPDTGEG